MKGWAPALLAGLLVGVFQVATSATAHPRGDTRASLVVDGRRLTYRQVFTLADVVQSPMVRADSGGSPPTFDDILAFMLEYLGRHLRIGGGAAQCRIADRGWDMPAAGAIELRLAVQCEREPEVLTLDYDAFFELAPRHRNIVDIVTSRRRLSRVLTAADRHIVVSLDEGREAVRRIRRAVGVGVRSGMTASLLLLGCLTLGAAPRGWTRRLAGLVALALLGWFSLWAVARGYFRLAPLFVEAAQASAALWVLWGGFRGRRAGGSIGGVAALALASGALLGQDLLLQPMAADLTWPGEVGFWAGALAVALFFWGVGVVARRLAGGPGEVDPLWLWPWPATAIIGWLFFGV